MDTFEVHVEDYLGLAVTIYLNPAQEHPHPKREHI